MSKTDLVLALLILAAVSLSCTFLQGGLSNSPYGVGDIHKTPLPSVDGSEPFPAMSTDAINALASEVPELAKHRENILEAERAALNGIFADVRAKKENDTAAVGSDPMLDRPALNLADDRFRAQINLIPAVYAADDPPAMPDMGGVEYFLIGHQAGFLTPDFGKVSGTDLGHSKTEKIKSDTTGEVIATTTTTVGADGTVTSEISTNINLPVMGLNANSKVKIHANQCPTSDGKIDLTIELSTNGRAGSSGSMIYDKTITAKLKATVNDNAETSGIDIDLKQATRSAAGGRQVFVETSQTGRGSTGAYSSVTFDQVKIVRTSSQATADDERLSKDGLSAAYNLAIGILENAKERWQGGGCVQIIADAPGTVAVNSTTQIPVKITHKIDASEVPSKLEAVLSGGSSVDPSLIPRTAGTLTYVAPGERGKRATIKLTSNSRRGRATRDLTASTPGQGYRVSGTSGPVTFSGQICDLNKGFLIDGTFPNGSEVQSFTPETSTSGTVDEDGESGGCTQSGKGTYKITLKDDGSGILEFTETVTGSCPPYSRTKTYTFRVTLTPASDLACP